MTIPFKKKKNCAWYACIKILDFLIFEQNFLLIVIKCILNLCGLSIQINIYCNSLFRWLKRIV